uniref:Peptidyl-prolyl cis-trans isomerase n=1 Tax=Chaetoceros debilis TaxID=122233 RepID=A0A7S3QJK0_9STRA|mmetsp:Transcript_15609/g.23387  ORF Transcript_15609/g.23387 Transcript_15609/m.23387 type:complete len:154 (-) Transcript_15609:195-656(-)
MNLFTMIMTLSMLVSAQGFTMPPGASRSVGPPITLHMGFFDDISKAFTNEEFVSPPEGLKATARHILIKDKGQVELVLNELEAGVGFNQVAKAFSACPSGSQGGSLGSFSPGTMVKEFDAVIFDPETNIGEIVGPVQTKFGYHLIVVDKRTGM